MDYYFYQTNTALYPVKSENSPTTDDDRGLLRKQEVDIGCYNVSLCRLINCESSASNYSNVSALELCQR